MVKKKSKLSFLVMLENLDFPELRDIFLLLHLKIERFKIAKKVILVFKSSLLKQNFFTVE